MATWVTLLAGAAIVAGFLARRKILRTVKGEQPLVTDDVLRRVLDEGIVEVPAPDEPLDEDRIRRAEDDFWAAEWEDPEPWGS